MLLSSPLPVQELDFNDSSPMFLRRSSLTSSLNDDDEDDGFLDVLDDNVENGSEMLTGMSSLLIAPLVSDSTGEYLPFLLPTVEGRHQDLNYITSDTGALNLHQEDRVEEFLLKTPIVPSRPEKRVILIFHCEFSSERGPRMCLFSRERDRALNDYPKLHYPELYILKGGYKDFFPHFQKSLINRNLQHWSGQIVDFLSPMVLCFLIHTVCPVSALSSVESRVPYSWALGPDEGVLSEQDRKLRPEKRRRLRKEKVAVVLRNAVSLSREASDRQLVDVMPGDEALALQEWSA
ncbi:hypothetical protein Q5P01_000633 [Channa striata]|uniref:protein-tyrosine-phosphatase n=1 Tax=Channa striata TaxID=64152 RepID=A0AA88IZK8_CHASR|nr:hypothetical protein Q5P01_000633 [Channa striata]